MVRTSQPEVSRREFVGAAAAACAVPFLAPTAIQAQAAGGQQIVLDSLDAETTRIVRELRMAAMPDPRTARALEMVARFHAAYGRSIGVDAMFQDALGRYVEAYGRSFTISQLQQRQQRLMTTRESELALDRLLSVPYTDALDRFADLVHALTADVVAAPLRGPGATGRARECAEARNEKEYWYWYRDAFCIASIFGPELAPVCGVIAGFVLATEIFIRYYCEGV